MKITPREGHLKIRFWYMVEFLEPSLFKIIDDTCPTAFCLSDDNGIGVLYGFLWQDSG